MVIGLSLSGGGAIRLIHVRMLGCLLSLSVTKWIHLNWGDEGVKNLFHKIYALLDEGRFLFLALREESVN